MNGRVSRGGGMSVSRRTMIAAGGIALLGAGTAVGAADPAPGKATATFEVYQDRGGEFRWRLRSQNGQILATASEGYKEKRACLAAIESVKKVAADAPVEEKAAGN